MHRLRRDRQKSYAPKRELHSDFLFADSGVTLPIGGDLLLLEMPGSAMRDDEWLIDAQNGLQYLNLC
jgi:hypothetical protein